MVVLLVVYTGGGGGSGGAEATSRTLSSKPIQEEPSSAEQSLLAHSGSINTIYMCDSCAGQITGGEFASVLGARDPDW